MRWDDGWPRWACVAELQGVSADPDGNEDWLLQGHVSDQDIRFYVWHSKKTCKALEAAGYEQVREPRTDEDRWAVSSQASGHDGFKIIGGDGRRRFGSWARRMPGRSFLH